MAKFTEHPRKQEAIAAIQQHLSIVGSRNWDVIAKQFEDVPRASLWRWIREAKKSDLPPEKLVTAKAKLAQKIKGAVNDRVIEAREDGVESIAKHLPAAPRPEYIARSGEVGLQNIDFVMEIQKLYRDAEMLRAYAVTKRQDAEGKEVEAIKNPVAFDKSIGRRTSILETAIRALQEIWDLRTMQSFYETVIEEIGKADPDTQRRIMERLADLNSRAGMTMSMRI